MSRSVLLVSNFQAPANVKMGARTVCENLAIKLEQAGWSVIKTSHYRSRPLRLLDMLLTILRKRKQYKVAHVAVFSGSAFLWAEASCMALRLLRKPYVLTLHGGNLPVFARRWPRRTRRLLQSAQIVVTPSHYLKDNMAEYVDKLLIIPNAIDLQRYSCRTRPPIAPRFVWLRAFNAIYNPTLAIKSILSLTEDFPDLLLYMLGPDRQDGSLQEVKALLAESGARDHVQLIGAVPREEVPVWLDRADILLNTPNIDNTPVSVIEAMAAGLCIVSTNVGGIPYLLPDEQTALLVPPDDPQAMTDAITRLLTDPDLALRLSQNARRKAEELDWSVVMPEWERVLEQAGSKS